MGIYDKDIETKLQEIPNRENILHNYDNWTYHIQLYMVPVDVYTSYTHIKSNFSLSETEKYHQIEKLILDNRIIIAESGVTSGISIDSLNLASFTPTTLENRETTTTSIDLSLSEVNSCTLMNKIAIASYVCGYESYTIQPFFLEIWFTGYSAKTGKPINKIPLEHGDNHIIYSCVMTAQSSIVETSKTVYKLKLYPYYYGALTKELNVVNDIGQIEVDTNQNFENYLEDIETKINEKIAGMYGKEVMDTLYKTSVNGVYAKPVHIIISNYGITGGIRNQISSEQKNVGRTLDEKVDNDYNIEGYNGGLFHDFITEFKRTSIKVWEGTKVINYHFLNGSKSDVSPEAEDTLTSFLRRICTTYTAPFCNTMGVTINFDYAMNYLGTLHGKMYYQHFIVITANEAPGLKEMNAMICKYDEPEKHYSDNPINNQNLYLDYLIKYNLLTKKYKWLLNGENIDVLNVKRSDDNLWYMNIGLSNIYNIKKNRLQNQFSFNNDTKEGPVVSENISESTIKKFNEIRNAKANNGDLYIDDIYNKALSDDDKQEGIKHLFGIVEASDPTAAIKPDSIPDSLEKIPDEQITLASNEVNYKVGMYNIFQYGGQKLKLDMDIIGDPFWLILGSEDDVLTHGCTGSTFMPHAILGIKTFMNYDKNDNYKEDKFMDLTTVYVITQVTSFFDNGKFTQKINGFVATPFIQSSAVEKNGVTVSVNEAKRAKSVVPADQS